MSNANTHKAKRDSRLDEVLGLATGHAKNELGDSENKSVTAAATLNVSSSENDVTEACGVNASVTLGATHSKTDAKAKK
ncbi:MAG: hypothetical protein IT343_17935 [Candidatus Melainabacteria bacterium]|jgi:hypothetical protein|nr:hypothetical protein [Candidatus Melainabacteria bacterium]